MPDRIIAPPGDGIGGFIHILRTRSRRAGGDSDPIRIEAWEILDRRDEKIVFAGPCRPDAAPLQLCTRRWENRYSA